MKTILLLAPAVGMPQEIIDNVQAFKHHLAQKGDNVCELLDVYEQHELDHLHCTQGELLGAAITFLIDKVDEVWLTAMWHESRECIALADIARTYGKAIRSAIATTNQNYIVRKAGVSRCPKNSTIVDPDQCRRCGQFFAISKDDKDVYCKIYPDL